VYIHELMQGLKDQVHEDENAQKFLAEGFDDVMDALSRQIPFPVSYGWICLRPPNEGADNALFQDMILNALRRVLYNPVPLMDPHCEDEKNIAVIGSGPAGLTAAWDLALKGYCVTVFERRQELGGMLRTGIPGYRLPNDIVDAEIERIKAIGVKVKTDTFVDRDLFADLVSGEQYAAVLIAAGARVSRKLRLDGEELQGVTSALDFLREYNLAGSADVGKNVIVIGGGNVATDAAGVAKHCGAESVRLFCLEDRENMPAHEWEIREVISEGVEINPSWGPKTLQGDGEKVTGVEFVRCVSVLDAGGRFSPVFDEKKTQAVEADMVITAIGQAPELSFLGGAVGTFGGAVLVDPYTMETNLPGVFAGGDAAFGRASLVEAIIDGKKAADAIVRYIRNL